MGSAAVTDAGRCVCASPAMAFASGSVIGWTIANVPLESLTAGNCAVHRYRGLSLSLCTPSRWPRTNLPEPPSGAWMVSQRAGRSPAVRNEWATPGGAARKPPAASVTVSASCPTTKPNSPSRT